MTYAVTNPPKCFGQAVGGGPRVWIYVDEDPHATVDTTDYFTNGEALGMQVDDVVVVVDQGAGATLHTVIAVDGDGASVSAGMFS